MKIIEQAPWSLETYCTGKGNGGGGCGTRLLVERDDLFNTNPGGVRRRHTYGFACLACSAWTDIPHADWPPDLQAEYDD